MYTLFIATHPQDKVISTVLCFLCLIGCGEAVAVLGLWSVELARLENGDGGISTEISIFATLTVRMSTVAIHYSYNIHSQNTLVMHH